MWLKASLDLTWEASGYIPLTALVNHLENFTFRSKAISHYMIERLNNRKLLYPSEISQLNQILELKGTHKEIGYTTSLRRLDEFLLGEHNWKGVPHQVIGIAERHFFI